MTQEIISLYAFPVDKRRQGELQLPASIAQQIGESVPPSRLVFHSATSGELEEVALIASYLDEHTRVASIAETESGYYWVVSSKEEGLPGRIYIPTTPSPGKMKWADFSDGTHVIARRFLNAFDSGDMMHSPFHHIGVKATDYCDFSHAGTRGSRNKWRDSVVFYMSIGGDAVLVAPNEEAAWFQLETNEIIPAGTLSEVVIRYLGAALRGDDFSSW